jgi:NADH-quinone oxidoreductase subunit J
VELIVFIAVALVAVAAALVVLLHRNPVIGALFLVTNLLCVAVLYLLLNALFLAVIQVIVYAGAIMVLILFVIMLLNLRREAEGVRAGLMQMALASAAAAMFLMLVARAVAGLHGAYAALPRGFGTVEYVGHLLFGDYFYPFEAISLVLLVAMAGAIVLAKRRL